MSEPMENLKPRPIPRSSSSTSQHRRDSAKDAYDQAAKQAEATRQVLRANGIDPKAAEIGFFSVNPQYNYKDQKHKIIGYQVTTSVSLKLKDFSKIGPITQQLADASVGESQSLSYTLDSTEEAKSKAVADAYRRARASAQSLATRQRTHARRTLVCVGRYPGEHSRLRARSAARRPDGHGCASSRSDRGIQPAERDDHRARERDVCFEVMRIFIAVSDKPYPLPLRVPLRRTAGAAVPTWHAQPTACVVDTQCNASAT